MNFLIHGDHQLTSRNFLNDLILKQKQLGYQPLRLNGKTLDLITLIQASTPQTLFTTKNIIIIENLFSRPKSKDLEIIFSWLKKYQGETSIIFWESKSIGKVLQRRLPQKITIKEFKTPTIIFKLVEQIDPSNIAQATTSLIKALKIESPEFIFIMVARQIRLLLLAKGKQKIPGAPWMVGKLKKQSQAFTPKELLLSYKYLYNIDKNIKTGQTIMPLSWLLKKWFLDLSTIGN